MTREERIIGLENQIKNIFYREIIGNMACIQATALINQWKVLTGWIEDKTPAIKGGLEEMFLDSPLPKFRAYDTRRHRKSSNLS